MPPPTVNFRNHPKTIWVLAAGGGISESGASMVIPLLIFFRTERHNLSLAAGSGLLALFFEAGTLGTLVGGSAAEASV